MTWLQSERLRDFVKESWQSARLTRSCTRPSHHSAQRDQKRKRDEKLNGGRQPDPISNPCIILPQRKSQDGGNCRNDRRLPEMIRDWRQEANVCHSFSFLNFWSAFRASSMSSSVNLPVSINCAITGCGRPPNRLNRSSTSFRWAAPREITASKMWALLIFFARRTAFLFSRRYTIVCTVEYAGLFFAGNVS